MHQMQTIVTDDCGVCLSVCLTCGLNRFHCAKTAEQIQILFGVNSLLGPRHIVLDGDHDPHIEGEGQLEKIWPIVDPLHMSGMVEHRDVKFCTSV